MNQQTTSPTKKFTISAEALAFALNDDSTPSTVQVARAANFIHRAMCEDAYREHRDPPPALDLPFGTHAPRGL